MFEDNEFGPFHIWYRLQMIWNTPLTFELSYRYIYNTIKGRVLNPMLHLFQVF